MIGYLRARSAARRARRQYELARLQSLMVENQRRLDKITRERNAPCEGCREMKRGKQ